MSASQEQYFGSEDDSWMQSAVDKTSEALPVTFPNQVASTSRQRLEIRKPSGPVQTAISPSSLETKQPNLATTRKREYDKAFSQDSKEADERSSLTDADSSFTLSESRDTSFSTLASLSPPAKLRKTTSGRFEHYDAIPPELPPITHAPPATQMDSGLPISPADFTKQFWGNTVLLTPFIIAHNKELQRLFDKQSVPWLTQFELQRGVIRQEWSVEDIMNKIADFGFKKDAETHSRVRTIMRGASSKTIFDDKIGRESDREQLAIEEGIGRGLGLMGDWHGEKDWYGGRIQQVATLVKYDGGFKLQLEPLEMQKSTRFARFLGSRRLIQIRMSKSLVQESRAEVIAFLHNHKFILNGRVFIPLPPKDRVCYAMETNENYERSSDFRVGDQFRMSFQDFLEWHNPIAFNYKQPVRKYFARFALGLSTSVPALEFAIENIHNIDDELVTEDYSPNQGKPPAEKIHTDGCSKINIAAAKLIAKRFQYSSIPTAMQGRIGGAKGLWTISFDGPEDTPRIWIRPSQLKIVHADLNHRSRRIFDLVEVSQSSTAPCFLSQQSVLNLSFNGVPADVFKKLMKKELDDAIRPLVDWTSPHSDAKLLDEIERNGRVMAKRLQGWSASLSRILGHTNRRDHTGMDQDTFEVLKDDDQDQDAYDDDDGLTGDVLGGAPSSLHECASGLVKNGFMPDRSDYLQEKLRLIIKITISSIIEKCRFALPTGTGTSKKLVITDPTGLLKPNEIYFRSSVPIVNPDTQTPFNVLEGDVVIGRYPANLPSDLQLVKAVNIPELERYTDVVVVPVKPTWAPRLGYVTFMTILSGGDADGDTVFLIWLKSIVATFKKKSLSLPSETFEKDNFRKEIENVTDFIARLASSQKNTAHVSFQKTSISGLADETVGIYSHYHDVAVWKHGYGSKHAIRLAYMFNTLLDGTKTGLVVLPDVCAADKYRASMDKQPIEHFKPSSARLYSNPTFILDVLVHSGEKRCEKLLIEFHKRTDGCRHLDADLLYPWKNVKSRIEKAGTEKPFAAVALQEDLNLIIAHVDESLKKYQEATASNASTKPLNMKGTGVRAGLVRKPKNYLQHVVAFFARTISGIMIMSSHEVERVKASYAYSLPNPKFGFCVAYATLCRIKSEASLRGGTTSTRAIDEARAVPAGVRKLFDSFAA